MSEEKRKILEMVKEGTITIEEGDELLRVLEEAKANEGKSKFKDKLKEDLNKTKSEILKAKDKIVEEYEKIDLSKVKEKIKKGIDKVDDAVKKVDDAILRYGEKIMKKDVVVDEDESVTLDPTKDDNISFYDKNKK